MQSKPNYLYRYTNVDSLRYMLLPPHTVRFNPLTVMDDKTEMKAYKRDQHGYKLTNEEGQFMFISCWTDMEEECMRMYKEYCRPIEAGLRIKMPVNPFSSTENDLKLNQQQIMRNIVNLTADALHYHFGREIPLEEIHKAKAQMKKEAPDFFMAIAKKEDEWAHMMLNCATQDVNKLLVQMNYTDSIEKLLPLVTTVLPNLSYSDYGTFGMYKDTSWAWQREWRYVLYISKYIKGHIKADWTAEPYPLPFDHYDLTLDSEKLKEMEITLSPMISPDARAEIRNIVDQSGFDISIVESRLIRE